MSFLLRAALVIGALSYCAMLRSGTEPRLPHAPDVAAALPAAGALPSLWEALPPAERERLVRAGAASLLPASQAQPETTAALAPSRDTLAEADRRPAWRGAVR